MIYLPVSSVNCEEVYKVKYICRKVDIDKVKKVIYLYL